MSSADVLEQRVERVVNKLLPETAFEGRYGPPKPLHERMAHWHTPGISVAVINDWDIEWTRGFGVREAGTTNAVLTDTLFQAGSISKPVFALAAMRLAQEGRLDLDEDVNTYLTSWRVPANGDWQPRVTLRQLLSHTAGLTVHGFPGYQFMERLPTLVQVLDGEPPANTARITVNIMPGIQPRYSGGGTTVAQQVLVDVLGMPFPEIMRTLVLDPLGMTDSTYRQPLPNDWAERAATGHPSKGIPLEGKYHIYPEMAAAGLWTTAADLAKAGVELLHVLDGRPARLLNREAVEAMLRRQLPESESDFFGLGFFCGGSGASFHFGHGGSNEGFVATMRFYRRLGKGAAVMVNSNEGFPLLDEIMRAIAREYAWPGVFPDEKVVVHGLRADDYLGSYVTEEGAQFQVISQDGEIALQFGRQPPLPIFATSELDFFAKAVNATVSFEQDAAGRITALTLGQEGTRIRAEKQ